MNILSDFFRVSFLIPVSKHLHQMEEENKKPNTVALNESDRGRETSEVNAHPEGLRAGPAHTGTSSESFLSREVTDPEGTLMHVLFLH